MEILKKKKKCVDNIGQQCNYKNYRSHWYWHIVFPVILIFIVNIFLKYEFDKCNIYIQNAWLRI